MPEKEWTTLRIGCLPATQELLIPFLWELGAAGFVEAEAELTAYIPSPQWNGRGSDLFDEYLERLKSEGHPLKYLGVETIKDRNWNEEWEKTITPIEVSGRVVITPSWRTPLLKPGQFAITIDPKMSFGTGYHETTRLMIRMMDKTLKPGMRVVDVGTGTGVLAIAAVKLGAASSIGVDNDEWSYDNACENVEKNGVAGNVVIRFGSLATVTERNFDMVLVNIHYHVIIEMMEELVEFLSGTGTMLLSGIMGADEEGMRNVMQKFGLKVEEILQEGEWIGIIGVRTSA